MASGYFIGRGDKTSCGGTVLDGDTLLTMFGIIHAREGDRVTCGKDSETYRILGGISFITSQGKRVAGSLDSISSCPCRATFYPRVVSRYTPQNSALPGARSAAPTVVATAPTTQPTATRTSAQLGAPSFRESLGEEPGFHIVQKSVRRELLRAQLLGDPSQAVSDKFNSLNPGLDLIKAGSIITLSDPNNHRCTREEAVLMTAATRANQALQSLSPEEADFMMEHREEIATFLSHGSTAVGVAEAMTAKHLINLESLIKEIELLHQRNFQKYGHLQAPEFFAERKRLFAQLDFHLNKLTSKGTGISDHPSLKRALGISSRSLVHHWTKAGGVEQIPGYTDHLSGVAKASKILAMGGWIGTGVGGTASYLKVQEVCAIGTKEECEKIKFTETGSFTGTWAGGFTGGAIGARFSGAIAATVCVGLGPATAGAATLACGLVVVGSGALVGGLIGGYAGEEAGEVIYRYTR